MTSRVKLADLHARDELALPPQQLEQRACNDQSFELPSAIYIAMGSMFVGFISVLAFAFRSNMAVSYGVIFAFIAAFFAVPALFPRVTRGVVANKRLDWHTFRSNGIATATGHASGREATILILLLPFLILCFAIAVATIAAVI